MQTIGGSPVSERETGGSPMISIHWVYKYALIPTITILLQNVIV